MNSPSRVSSTLLAVAAAVIVVAGLKLAQPLLAPLLLAGLLTATFAPIAAWLSARGAPAGVSAGVALLVGVVAVAVCGLLIGYSADEVRANIPAYWSRAQDGAGSAAAYLTRLGFHATRESVLSFLDAGRVMVVVGGTLTAGADLLPHVILMPLLVFFALAEIAVFGDKLRVILPTASRGLDRIEAAVSELQKYLVVKTATSLCTAVACGLLLQAFRVDFAVLLALLVFLLHFIPNLGSVIATVPAVLVALLQHGSGAALGVAAGYLVINGVIGNVIEPKVMGRTLGLSPLVVLLAMVFWGWLWGPIGAFLSVPLTMIAKILLEDSPSIRWIAVLIGNAKHLPASTDRTSLIPTVLRPLWPTARPGGPIGLGAGARTRTGAIAPQTIVDAGPPPSSCRPSSRRS